MVFYLDLILLLNFLIDYLLLLITSRILNLKVNKIRLLTGALIGAVYTLTFFIPNLTIFQLIASKIILSFVIIFVSFGYIHLFRFFQMIATFYFVSFILGGGVLAIQYMFNIEHEIINGIYVSHSSNPLTIIIIIFISFILVMLFSNRTLLSINRRMKLSKEIFDVEFFIDNDSYLCKGLVDTGNRLYDPITRKPVMVIEANNIDFLPRQLKNVYQNGQFQLEEFYKITNDLESKWLSRIQLVPFRTVSKGMQFLITIRPDKVVVIKGDEGVINNKVLIGLDYEQLSNDNSYQAIIHPDLVIR